MCHLAPAHASCSALGLGNGSELLLEVLDILIDRVEAMRTGLDEELVERHVERVCSGRTGQAGRRQTLLPKMTAVNLWWSMALKAVSEITVADHYPPYLQTPCRSEFTTGRNDASPHSCSHGGRSGATWAGA